MCFVSDIFVAYYKICNKIYDGEDYLAICPLSHGFIYGMMVYKCMDNVLGNVTLILDHSHSEAQR